MAEAATGAPLTEPVAAPTADPPKPPSPLGAARLHRQLTIESAAQLAGLPADEVEWLEEGRIYRFRTTDDALAAAVVYATALGIEPAEARELAGLPAKHVPPSVSRLTRAAAIGAAVVAAGTLGALLVRGLDHRAEPSAAARRAAAEARLPPPWRVDVDVLNGSGDINYTRTVASRVGSIGYRIHHVGRASRFDYVRTAVYYEPGGQPLAVRLARQLGVVTMPLPAGRNPRRLVVIVGPHRGPG
jgi:hypothetical protein